MFKKTSERLMRTKCCNQFVGPSSLASKLSVQVRGVRARCRISIGTNVETINLFFHRPVMLQCPLKDHLEDSSVVDEGRAKETLISKKSIYDVSLDDEV